MEQGSLIQNQVYKKPDYLFVQLEKGVLKAVVADTFPQRLAGLLFKSELAEDEALLIKRCSDIHTFFMSFPVDVIFLSKQYKVLSIYSLVPFRVAFNTKAKHVLEVAGGSAERYGIEVGMTIVFTETLNGI